MIRTYASVSTDRWCHFPGSLFNLGNSETGHDASPARRHAVNAAFATAAMQLARTPGTYALILENAQLARRAIGRLGLIDLPAGFYVYVGSALGPGGLQARVGRHLGPTRAVHWHIDYLRRAARIVEVWYVFDPVRREHTWADALGRLTGVSIPVPGFGSSDCDCAAHLFHFTNEPRLAQFARALRRMNAVGSGRSQSLRRLPIVNAG